MRSKLTLFAMWLVATTAAAGVAWQAIAYVDDDRALPPASRPPRAGPTTARASGSAPPPVAPGATPPAPIVSLAPTVASTVSSTSPPSASAPSAPSPSTAPAPVVVLSVPPPQAVTPLTFELVGGSVAANITPTAVTIDWAVPNPGFEVEIEPEVDGVVKVEFRSGSHRSRIDLWWANGPQHSVRERED